LPVLGEEEEKAEWIAQSGPGRTGRALTVQTATGADEEKLKIQMKKENKTRPSSSV
jgi:hypothetical protein